MGGAGAGRGAALNGLTPTTLGLAAAAAVLLFWAVGGYNRLMAQRNQIADAWGRLHDTLRQRAAAVEPLLTELQQPMAAEAGALQTFGHAHAQALRCAAEMATRPVDLTRAAAWVAAEIALAAAATRVLALLEQQPALAASEPVAGPLAAWRGAQERLPFARQAFNDCARGYNDALALFPTRLLARGFGFLPAGLL